MQDSALLKSTILDIPDELSRIKSSPDRLSTVSDDEEVIFVGADMMSLFDRGSIEFVAHKGHNVEAFRQNLVKVMNYAESGEQSSLISAYSLGSIDRN